jgi:hypothetical protein
MRVALALCLRGVREPWLGAGIRPLLLGTGEALKFAAELLGFRMAHFI